jgi:hypothetical protein
VEVKVILDKRATVVAGIIRKPASLGADRGPGLQLPTADNNAVRASARFARSGVHGAYGAHKSSSGWKEWGGARLRGARAGAASRTSERYVSSRE